MMQENQLLVNGLSINISSAGSPYGRPVIFLHSASFSLEMWKNQLHAPALQQYRLIALDFPGHGKSEHSKEPGKHYTFKGLSNILIGFIQELQLTDYLLVGLSLGTNIIAEAIPKLRNCKGIVLGGPTMFNNECSPEKIFLPSPYGHITVTPHPPEKDLDNLIGSALGSLSTEYFQYGKKAFLQTDPVYRSILGQVLVNQEWTDQIANLRSAEIPLCIIQGKKENIVKAGYLESIKWSLWGNRIHYLEDAMHFVNWEDRYFNETLTNYAMFAFNGRK